MSQNLLSISLSRLGSLVLAAATWLGLACPQARAQLPPDFPGLRVTAYDPSAVGAGFVFLEMTDASADATRYVMMLDNDGTPVWSQVASNSTYDFKVLPNGWLHWADLYHTHSWTGGGDCTHRLLADDYSFAETISAGNGYVADGHDFQLLPNGHVLLLGYYKTRMDVSRYVVGGYPNALLAGAVLQELDGQRNVVFQWRSWDHFTIPSYFPPTAYTNSAAKNPVIDAFHLNTVVLDDDGHLLVSNFGMDVWKISRQTGQILWRLGGPGNQFTFVGENPQQALGHFSGHTLTRLANGHLLIYCNADQAGTRSSKVYEYQLDEANKVATLVWSYAPPTNYYAWHYGSAQRLPNGNTFIGWGGANIIPGVGGATNQWIPACSEVTPEGRVVFEVQFDDPRVASYRAYRSLFPPASYVNLSWYNELATGNYYDFDQTGLSLTVLEGGGGYNQLTVVREEYAPLRPQFEGRAPRLLCRRVALSHWGLPELAGFFEFDAASFGLADPGNLTVYYRPQAGAGVFLPQTAEFNPVRGKLGVTMFLTSPGEQLGEFAFGVPDVAAVALPPLLAAVENYRGVPSEEVIGPLPAAPDTTYPVNQERPIALAWSPQGLANGYQVQIATHLEFADRVLDIPWQTEAILVWSNAAPDTPYYYRVSTTNDAGASGWAVGSFHTEAPRLTVTAPNGGETWRRGLRSFIQWDDNLGGPVVIDLYKHGAWLKALATNATAGAFPWPVGLDLAPGADYSIQIRSASQEGLSDASDAPFSLDVPKITRFQPNPGGAWVLEWTGSPGAVQVEFNRTLAPGPWQTLTGPISGSAWTNPPQTALPGFYRLRLP